MDVTGNSSRHRAVRGLERNFNQRKSLQRPEGFQGTDVTGNSSRHRVVRGLERNFNQEGLFS